MTAEGGLLASQCVRTLVDTIPQEALRPRKVPYRRRSWRVQPNEFPDEVRLAVR
jgi:hypothetical protein